MCKLLTPQDFNNLSYKQQAVLKLIVADNDKSSPQIPLTSDNAKIGCIIWDGNLEFVYLVHSVHSSYNQMIAQKKVSVKKLQGNGTFAISEDILEQDLSDYTIIGQVDNKRLAYLYTLIPELNHF